MRIRSYKFTNTKEYTDTTYYNEDEHYLDIGYQMLVKFNINLYPQLEKICKLFIDHNIIKQLPDTTTLPHLTELSCSFNKLTEIPYYPNLVTLNASNNLLEVISNYENSNIEHLDVSFNDNFKLNVCLPKCERLFMTDCLLDKLELSILPTLKICDVENNNLTSLTDHKNLIELNIKNNLLKNLLSYPSLRVLYADYNQIQYLNSYDNLKELTITYNKLIYISDQPKLTRLLANHNKITKIGFFPRMKIIDLSYNALKNFIIGEKITHCSLQFNPLELVTLPNMDNSKLKELQIGFDIYKKIYSNISNNVKDIEFKNNNELIREYLKQYCLDKWTDNICIKFQYIKFMNEKIEMDKIAKALRKYTDLDHENIRLILSEIYYKTLIINIYL